MADAGLDAEALKRVAAVVRKRTHLQVKERALEVLEQLVGRRLASLGLSVDEYLQRLQASTPECGELEWVTRELTVGETYFFRGAQLEAIRTQLLPRLVARRREAGRHELRVLSAGCATGEEPYSLVMILSELLPDFERWHVSVIGLDINTAFLQRAEQAVYSHWSLRDVPEGIIRRHFVRHGERHQVAPSLRSKVRFQYANLALDPLPAPALGVVAMDLILCQNVLYYFEHDVRQMVAERLARCLSAEGYLVLGAADLLNVDVPLCRPRAFGELVAFQRTQRLSKSASTPPSRRLPPRLPTPAPMPAVTESAARAAEHPELSVELAQAIASDGDLRGAIAHLEGLLQADPERADAHALHGFLLTELGSLRAALEAFRRSTYLEPDLLLAHAGAAMTARRLGQSDVAKRASARVRVLVQRQPPDTVVEGWEGMTAGRLLRLFAEETANPIR
jgi:chemotaxis protein methyltransferase CheR